MQNRIKAIRRSLDLTQQEFADKVGIKRSTVANYEIGRNDPVDSVIVLICREFGVNEAWLRTGEGEMFVPDPQSEMDALAEKYRLSPMDRALVESYMKLDAKQRQAVNDFIMKLIDENHKAKEPELPPIEEMVDEYRRQLILERATRGKGGQPCEGTGRAEEAEIKPFAGPGGGASASRKQPS